VATQLREGGFTAGSSEGEELGFFTRFRIDKKEFNCDENTLYFQVFIIIIFMNSSSRRPCVSLLTPCSLQLQLKRAVQCPPPRSAGRVAIEVGAVAE
jgi:hypothetical protein